MARGAQVLRAAGAPGRRARTSAAELSGCGAGPGLGGQRDSLQRLWPLGSESSRVTVWVPSRMGAGRRGRGTSKSGRQVRETVHASVGGGSQRPLPRKLSLLQSVQLATPTKTRSWVGRPDSFRAKPRHAHAALTLGCGELAVAHVAQVGGLLWLLHPGTPACERGAGGLEAGEMQARASVLGGDKAGRHSCSSEGSGGRIPAAHSSAALPGVSPLVSPSPDSPQAPRTTRHTHRFHPNPASRVCFWEEPGQHTLLGSTAFLGQAVGFCSGRCVWELSQCSLGPKGPGPLWTQRCGIQSAGFGFASVLSPSPPASHRIGVVWLKETCARRDQRPWRGGVSTLGSPRHGPPSRHVRQKLWWT